MRASQPGGRVRRDPLGMQAMSHPAQRQNPDRRRLIQAAGASLAVAATGAFSLRTARAGSGTRLHILHINDMHSRLEPVTASDGTCRSPALEAGDCHGGAARLATAIRQRRAALAAEGVPVLTLDAGDQSQGTLFYTAHGGKAEIEMMNLIGFDAMTLGNHEFNRGPEALAAMLAMAEFPVVSGNTVVEAGHPLARLVHDRLVIARGDLRIGILGVTTPDTALLSSPGPSVRFTDPSAHLRDAVARLRAEGVRIIVVLSHLGFAADRALAAEVAGISLIVGGHSHTLMSNTVPGAPAYATVVASPSGRAVPVLQAYAFSRYLGDLAVEVDADGAVVLATGDTIALAAGAYPEAEDVAARIAALAGPVEALRTKRVATLDAAVDGSRASCRRGACAMGNLVADAMVARMAAAGVGIALTNAGGLRGSLAAGPVTLGDVLTVLPFQNTLVTLEVTGATLIAALEHGVGAVEEGSGRFPQVSGLRFRLDTAKPPGAGRVSAVELRRSDGWVHIDMSAPYAIVTNSFLARGGDGYAMLASMPHTAYDTAIDMADALAEHLATRQDRSRPEGGRILQ